jgi:branched-subunit amino acid ABC-type transport system permease component
MQSALSSSSKSQQTLKRLLLLLPFIYIGLLILQPAGLDPVKIVDNIRNDPTIIIQQLINGLANGAIIAIIALGYTLVYGIIELVNFANGDVFMLGTMTALLALSPFIYINPDSGASIAPWWAAFLGFIPAMLVGALINWATERIAYRRLRNSPKLVVLISAIGMSFILQNVGLQLGATGKLAQLQTEPSKPLFSFFGNPVRLDWSVFDVYGNNHAAPKSFPSVISNDNLLDYIFPPPPIPTQAPDTAPSGGEQLPAQPAGGQVDVQATAFAAVEATQTAEAKATPLPANEQPTADPSVPTEEPTPTLDPTQIVEETAIMATVHADETKIASESTPESPETPTPSGRNGGKAIARVLSQDATPTEEPLPTLDPTQAAEETSIIATLSVEETNIAATDIAGTGTPTPPLPGSTPEPTAQGGGVYSEPKEEPTIDLKATIEAEQNALTTSDGSSVEQPQSTNKIRITFKDLLVIVTALVLMTALNWFIQNTRLGKAMRATAQNRAAAQIMGINIDNIISLTFIIGGALAGAAGMMSGIYNGTAVFTMGFTAGLRSFTAAVLGGIGNIRGAALGGILIGILAAFSDQFFSVRWTNAWVFLILVLVLIFRPTGLLGSEGGEKA